MIAKECSTDISISTKWFADPVRRKVTVQVSSSHPLAHHSEVAEWIEMARPELPCFFEPTKSDYYLSQDGCRLLAVFEDKEIEAPDEYLPD